MKWMVALKLPLFCAPPMLEYRITPEVSTMICLWLAASRPLHVPVTLMHGRHPSGSVPKLPEPHDSPEADFQSM